MNVDIGQADQICRSAQATNLTISLEEDNL